MRQRGWLRPLRKEASASFSFTTVLTLFFNLLFFLRSNRVLGLLRMVGWVRFEKWQSVMFWLRFGDLGSRRWEFVFVHRMQAPWKHLEVEQAIVLRFDISDFPVGLESKVYCECWASLRKRIPAFPAFWVAIRKGRILSLTFVWLSLGTVASAMVRDESETWLILPVVICLSQRLSHACLSISFFMAKLRMAH